MHTLLPCSFVGSHRNISPLRMFQMSFGHRIVQANQSLKSWLLRYIQGTLDIGTEDQIQMSLLSLVLSRLAGYLKPEVKDSRHVGLCVGTETYSTFPSKLISYSGLSGKDQL